MKAKIFLFSFILICIFSSCSKHIEYSEAHIKETSGRYQFNENDVIDVYYKNNDLFIKWKGGSIKPVVLDENTFFVADMYKKLRFVIDPKTQKRYLGVVSEKDENQVSYEYLKVAVDFSTPRMYFTNGDYEKATIGYLELQKQDTTKAPIEEYEVNKVGYRLLRNKEYNKAIGAFKMNVALNPESDNVYDSLAEAYLYTKDSIQAYNTFKKALELNSGNKRAKAFVEVYEKNHK